MNQSILHYVVVPIVEMREKPSVASQVVSQAFFSELVHVFETSGDWIKIETSVDRYSGWIKTHSLYQRSVPFTSSAKIDRLSAHLYHTQNTIYGPMLTLPYESKLQLLESSQDGRWFKIALPDEREGYIQRGDVLLEHKVLTCQEMCAFSKRFLGLPYTWGGRSSFGYDCSGFVQMLYRQMGISLPRDSKDQMLWEGFVTHALDDPAPGVLLFFGSDPEKIVHVGMSLGGGVFIHSTVAENAPYIRISHLSDKEWNGLGKLSYRAAKAVRC